MKYKWEKFGKWNSVKINASIERFDFEPDSEIEFIIEHYWGYAKVDEQKTNEYEVTHPKWKVYKVNDFVIKVDFGTVYGKEFEFLNTVSPNSVMLAEGSEITVENKTVIKTDSTTMHMK